MKLFRLKCNCLARSSIKSISPMCCSCCVSFLPYAYTQMSIYLLLYIQIQTHEIPHQIYLTYPHTNTQTFIHADARIWNPINFINRFIKNQPYDDDVREYMLGHNYIYYNMCECEYRAGCEKQNKQKRAHSPKRCRRTPAPKNTLTHHFCVYQNLNFNRPQNVF